MECSEDEKGKELPRLDLQASAPGKGYPGLAAHDLAELELKNVSTGGGPTAPVGHQYSGHSKSRHAIQWVCKNTIKYYVK